MVDMDRARGLMTGIAVGNLLGIPVESWPRRHIAEAYPEGMREIVARSGYPDDDDLAQAIEIRRRGSSRRRTGRRRPGQAFLGVERGERRRDGRAHRRRTGIVRW